LESGSDGIGDWIGYCTCHHLKEVKLVYKNFWSEPTQMIVVD